MQNVGSSRAQGPGTPGYSEKEKLDRTTSEALSEAKQGKGTKGEGTRDKDPLSLAEKVNRLHPQKYVMQTIIMFSDQNDLCLF